MRRLRAPALIVLGAAGIVLSLLLPPTHDTFMVLTNGHRVRIPADMHAVDYIILILRIGGVVAVLVGAYLAYRAWRPDGVQDRDGMRVRSHSESADIPADAGVHVPAAG